MAICDLDPDLLRAFVAVADYRSFTRAAVMLHRTQSAASMQIKRLEERLDVALFIRTKAHVELSASGEALLGYARRILLLNQEAVDRLREHTVEGVVRLGVMTRYGMRGILHSEQNAKQGKSSIFCTDGTDRTSTLDFARDSFRGSGSSGMHHEKKPRATARATMAAASESSLLMGRI